jgi:hypothetical protein
MAFICQDYIGGCQKYLIKSPNFTQEIMLEKRCRVGKTIEYKLWAKYILEPLD